MAERSTGWKMPLLICLIVLLGVGVKYLLTADVPLTPLPAPLVAEAKTFDIRADMNREGEMWMEQITTSSSGMAQKEGRDRAVELVARKALAMGRFSAACTAAAVMFHTDIRDTLLNDIGRAAAENRETLPWAVYATEGMAATQMREQLHQHIIARWQALGGK